MYHASCLCLNLSYPLLKLPLPGTGPVEYSTPVKDYSPPSSEPGHQQGDPSERPDWVGLLHVGTAAPPLTRTVCVCVCARV